MIVRAPCMAKCESLVHTYHDAPWPRGQTPVLLNLGTMFDPLAEEGTFFSFNQLSVALAMHLVLWAILNALAPLGAGVSVIAPLPERLLGLIEGSFMTTVFFRVRVPGS